MSDGHMINSAVTTWSAMYWN